MKFPMAIALLAAAAPLGAERANGSLVSAMSPSGRAGDVVWNQARGNARGQNDNVRFQGYDANGDGVITRAEWRGSDRSFDVHDWNDDGVLSGNEVRAGSWRPRPEFDDYSDDYVFNDWSQARFGQLDRNNDGRLTRAEWPYGAEEFLRVDRNRDNALTVAEFTGADYDDDRSDRFDNLDVNGNGAVERGEWHASPLAFNSLDRDNNGSLSRQEMGVDAKETNDVFARVDANRDERISAEEWLWSRRSFSQRDANGDGAITRSEFGARPAAAQARGTGAGTSTVIVQANREWNDTGITVRAGDRLTFNATGSVQLSHNADDIADPSGAKSGRSAANGPLPREKAGVLVARFGENGAPVVIGAAINQLHVPAAGRLYLGVNDDHHDDNTGSFRVAVTLAR